MVKSFRVTYLAFLAAALVLLPSCIVRAQTPTRTLVEWTPDVEKRLTPTPGQVTVARSQDPAAPGLVVRIQPGKDGYPGVRIKPEGSAWDLSSFGHVAARVVNTGSKPLYLVLRVDDAGDWRKEPWNAEGITLPPGEAGTVKTIFGYSYGYKPGYALKPKAVVGVLLFTTAPDGERSFRIESLVAGGPAGEKPPVAPEAVRVRPAKGGFLLGGSGGVEIDAARQIATQNGARATLVGAAKPEALRVVFPAGQSDASASFKPAVGRWDLRDCVEVRVRVRNEGKAAVTPRVRLETNGGASDWTLAATPLAPGAETVLVVPFAGATVLDLGKPGTGSKVTSDAASAVTLGVKANGEAVLRVASVWAGLPPAPTLPAWLGKCPPVPGEWVKTLDDEFNGNKIDPSVWSVYGANYWDKASHWSKDNVLIGNGVVRLRYEKKTGFNNDDPKETQSAYASGYLHTYDRWAQRYGYFEARMKLPTAPGLWPAFWMMPDRGPGGGPEQWRRQDTANGGMEFDIMENLTRWGGNRYNIAMHYDGYGKDHKSLGTDKIYLQPDKDGFITCGLLWTPGLAVYYGNGREVLRWENPRIADVPAILMFTLPQGGWDNSPVEDARLPDDFAIDYVRVWQRKDLASAADGKRAAKAP